MGERPDEKRVDWWGLHSTFFLVPAIFTHQLNQPLEGLVSIF
jgi:hypothetical protein